MRAAVEQMGLVLAMTLERRRAERAARHDLARTLASRAQSFRTRADEPGNADSLCDLAAALALEDAASGLLREDDVPTLPRIQASGTYD
jgi:transposase-like protein